MRTFALRTGVSDILVVSLPLILVSFFLFPFFAFASAIVGSANTASLQKGLVGYWTFDGNDTPWTSATAATTLDKSGNGNTGTLTNMDRTTSPTPGKIGQGLKFDGTNQTVDGGNGPSVNISGNAVTLAAWIKKSNSFGSNEAVVAKRSAAQQYAIETRSSGNIRFGTYGASNQELETSTNPLSIGTWQHIVAVYDGSNKYIYVNNVLIKSVASTGNLTAGTDHVSIGSLGGSNFFNGSIDDVRVYNRALSSTEVAQLYRLGSVNIAHSNPSTSSGQAPLSKGLVGYWTFDGNDTPWTSATAATTLDKSGNGNTGTLTSMNRATSPTPGKIGQGLKFDGVDDYVNTPYTTAIGTADFTYSVWFKTSVSQTGGIIGKRHGSTSYIQLDLFMAGNAAGSATGGKIVFYDGSDLSILRNPISTNALNDGKWHHAVGVRTSLSSTLYIDGRFEASSTSASGNLSNTDPIFIGNLGDSGSTLAGFFFNGLLDDVRVYNRALSSTEVAQLYRLGSVNIAHSNPSTSSGQAPLSKGLVGYWSLDGSQTNWTTNKTNDISGNNNTGTLVSMSTTTAPTPGKIGQGLNFDGSNDYVSVGASSSLNITSSFSISAWVKLDTLPVNTWTSADSGRFVVVHSNGTGDSNTSYYLWIGNLSGTPNKIVFGFKSSTAYRDHPYTWSSIVKNRWYHIVGIFDDVNNTLKIYLDGIQVLSEAETDTPQSVNVATSIGGWPQFSTNPYFDGPLDDVRVYNRAFSATEVAQLYKMSK